MKKKMKLLLMLVSIAISVVLGVSVSYVVFLAHVGVIYLALKLVNRFIKIDKRILLLISVGLSVVIMSYGYYNMHKVRAVGYELNTKKNIRSEGYRAVLISDVHTGLSLSQNELEKIAEEIEESEPDMVLLCGDIVDENTTKRQMQSVFKIFGKIKSEFGTFYVYGNHDRQFRNKTFTQEELQNAITEGDITILRDQAINLNDEFVLAGREDYSAERILGNDERKTMSEILNDIDRDDFILVMDHQPRGYSENSSEGTDLLVSGHTHAGQIVPGNLVLNLIPFGDGVYGEYKVGDMRAYVSAGLAGWGLPFKTSAPAEYVIIDIQAKK